nr:ankyrin repeat and SAM domain-containing protein 6-like isoform X1 [Ipomoea batatas]
MSRTQVTITLGRSGQRVVKHPSGYDGASGKGQRLSGSKRSLAEPFVSNANGSLLTKRIKGDARTQGSRYIGPVGARIGNNDLRLKLLRKRMSKQILETEDRKKKQMQAKMSGISQSSTQQYERIHSTDTPLPRRVPLDLAASNGLRTRSPNRVLKDSREVASSRNINEFQRAPLTRPVDATRTVRLMGSDPVNPSRSNFPAPAMLGVANGSVPRSSYPDQEPVTVTGLLNALGLGKYAIHFQAEEVDMAALKQMGDCDLKELGIPMGPRKKISLAIMAYNKKPKPT